MTRSARVAWTVAGIAIALLIAVFFLGAGNAGSTAIAGIGGLGLLAILACPISMGAMMWFMMRKGH